MSQCVLCLSGLTDQLRRKKKRCMRLIGTLQGGVGAPSWRAGMNSERMSGSDRSRVPSFLSEGTSDGGRYGPQSSEIVGIMIKLMDETSVDFQTLEKMESELFKAEGAPSVKLKDDHAFDQQVGDGNEPCVLLR